MWAISFLYKLFLRLYIFQNNSKFVIVSLNQLGTIKRQCFNQNLKRGSGVFAAWLQKKSTRLYTTVPNIFEQHTNPRRWWALTNVEGKFLGPYSQLTFCKGTIFRLSRRSKTFDPNLEVGKRFQDFKFLA